MSNPPVAVIVASFAAAIALTLMPLPELAAPWRPQWVALTLIYWTLALPGTIGIGSALLLGLFVDAATGAILGQHSLGLVIVAYITLRLHQRLRWFPVYQQALFVGLTMLPCMSALLWVNGMLGYAQESGLYWAPVLGSMVAWPCVFMVLRSVFKPAPYYYR